MSPLSTGRDVCQWKVPTCRKQSKRHARVDGERGGRRESRAMIDVVCAVIVNPQGQYLACLRPLGKHLGGLWEFPGGKVDPGESPETALVRELREELAVKVEVGRSLAAVIWNYEARTIRLLPYFCKITAGEPQALEHEALRWIAPQDFGELRWADADLPILKELIGQITV